MTHSNNTMEIKITNQLGETPKTGIYEVFVNHQDYYTYYGLGVSSTPNMNQKMYAVVWDSQLERLCLEERKAWGELRAIAAEEGVVLEL